MDPDFGIRVRALGGLVPNDAVPSWGRLYSSFFLIFSVGQLLALTSLRQNFETLPLGWKSFIIAYCGFTFLVSLLMSVTYNHLHHVEPLLRVRYQWGGKATVGTGMLVVATTVSYCKTQSLEAMFLQLSICFTLFSILQLLRPFTDFGLLNFMVRIPLFTSFSLYGMNNSTLGIFFAITVCLFFHEYYSYCREQEEAMALAQAAEASILERLSTQRTYLTRLHNTQMQDMQADMERRFLAKALSGQLNGPDGERLKLVPV